MLLPLVRRRERGLTLIEPADLSVSDYSYPLLGPAAPATRAEAEAALAAATHCLPRADLLVLRSIPLSAGRNMNPLALLDLVPSTSVRNTIELPETWDQYIKDRSRSFRKGYYRKRRAIGERGKVDVRFVTDPDEAHRRLSQLEEFQRTRLDELGEPYVLDQPCFSDFYHDIVTHGLTSGFAIVPVLTVDDVLVAAGFGLVSGTTCTMVRLCHAEGDWIQYSPSTILACDTIRLLIESGVKTFDFGKGDNAYKQHFGCKQIPLYRYQHAMSLKGRLAIAALNGRDAMKRKRLWPFDPIVAKRIADQQASE